MEPIKTIGTILPEEVTYRDAIHIAILPVVADDDYLGPGTLAKLVYGAKNTVGRAHVVNHAHGVIDPFLEYGPKRGQRCWLFLKPGTITGLRHEWTHPDIDGVKIPVGESEHWLRMFASKWNFDYDLLLSEAKHPEGSVTAEGIDLHGADELGEGEEELFWLHLEKVTGREFDTVHRERFTWSCSC